jgi:hypothetical protein
MLRRDQYINNNIPTVTYEQTARGEDLAKQREKEKRERVNLKTTTI